ncbi:MAG: glycerophosphodiester phosphodiesterase [Stappiaceae bacterium]
MTSFAFKNYSACKRHIFRSIALCFAILLSGGAVIAADFLVIAHRGASGYLPEHTREAKVAAYFSGADFLEQDVVLSKDGVPMVIHDLYLDATTDVANIYPGRSRADGRFYAIDFSLSELKQLKVRERVDLKTGNQTFPNRFPGDDPGFGISTLEEEIQLIQGMNASTGRNVGLYAEIKAPHFHAKEGKDLSKAVLDVLDQYGYTDAEAAIYIQSFDFNEIKRLRMELGYKGKLVQLLGENRWNIAPDTDYEYLKSKEGLRELAMLVDGIGPWIGQLVEEGDTGGKPATTGLAEAARDAGLAVHAYTLRSDRLPDWASDFDVLLEIAFSDLALDGAFTDFPDKMVAFRQRKAGNR